MSFKEGDLVRFKKGLWRLDRVHWYIGRDDYRDERGVYTTWVVKHVAGPRLKFFFKTGIASYNDLEALTEMEVLALAAK